jgi:hypothetical protein
MTDGVLIRGEGIAAFCCSHLLAEAGVPIKIEKVGRPRLPAIMVGEATQKLLRDLFRCPDLLEGLPKIRRRVVSWGPESKPVVLPHAAIVVSEEELWFRIRKQLRRSPNVQNDVQSDVQSEDLDWTIFASTPFYSSSIEHHFGSRIASASPVRLQPRHDAEACWIESLETGWMFLLPTSTESGWLLSVGGSPGSMLSRSSLIKEQVAELLSSRGTFASHPRAVVPLSGPRWLACGSAAISFDPLCGDGTGNALREAILAAGVICAANAGGNVDSLVAHYQTRLVAGLQRHIAHCIDFYRSGRSGAWWDRQLEDLVRALAWCQVHIRENSEREIQNCQPIYSLSASDQKLLTRFINGF